MSPNTFPYRAIARYYHYTYFTKLHYRTKIKMAMYNYNISKNEFL